MPRFQQGAVFLGQTAPLGGAAAATPTLVFGPGWGKLFIYQYIAGYSSGGGIALIQFGAAGVVDTGNNYSSWTQQFGTNSTAGQSRVSQAGIHVANDSTTNGRRGLHEVWNPEGNPKMCDSRTNTFSSQNPVSQTTAQSTMSLCCGHWWNNSQAQCVAMNGGGVNLLAGSYITVYGIPGMG